MKMNKSNGNSNESVLAIPGEQPTMKDSQPAKVAEGAACPIWMNKRSIHEPLFCQEFRAEHPLIRTENTFFTPEGKLNDEGALRSLMEALQQAHHLKTITTASVKMDLECKGKQSYQGWMYARLLGFSNGDLVSLYDHSDGFFRRQLILTTKPKPDGRKDDPRLAEKMCDEMEGIFLWALDGLKRLIANDFRFRESQRIIDNRNAVRQDANNLIDFMHSEGYIRFDRELSIPSEELMDVYQTWCNDNAEQALRQKTARSWLHANQAKFGIEHSSNVKNKAGKRVRGFLGIGRADRLPSPPED